MWIGSTRWKWAPDKDNALGGSYLFDRYRALSLRASGNPPSGPGKRDGGGGVLHQRFIGKNTKASGPAAGHPREQTPG